MATSMSVRRCAAVSSRAFALLSLLMSVPGPASAALAPLNPSPVTVWGTPGSPGGQFTAPSALATDALGNVYVVDTGNHRIQKFDGQGHFITRWGALGTGPNRFSSPAGIAVDPSGSVLVVDTGNSKIKEFDSNGVLMHQWGTAGTGSGQFTSAVGIATDAAGDFYVSDGADRVQKFASDGTFILQWGSTGAGDGQFSAPAGIAVDAHGAVYVVDQSNARIQKFSADGVYLAQWGTLGAGPGQFDQPFGVAVDALGVIYVADIGNSRIQKFTSDGTAVTMWGSLGAGFGQFDLPSGVAIDASGNVFVVEINNARVQKFSGAGASAPQVAPTFSSNIGSFGSANGQINTPYAVATDASGWIYVADTFNYRVQKFSGNGVFYLKFGSAGGGPGQFASLYGIAADAFGNIFVTSSDGRVEKFSSTGTYLLQWGSVGAGAGQFSGPSGIAVDAAGDVYVVDTGNSRVQRFSGTGTFLTQWGSAGSGAGQFSNPRGIAADRAGNIYIADGNARVQKFTSTGSYIGQWALAMVPGNASSSLAVDSFGDIYAANTGPTSNIQKFRNDGALLAQWGSYGSGAGQFAPPYGVAVDGTGNVYAADYGGNRIVKFVTTPAILLVSDVGNDQGRQTRLRIQGASVDAPANGGVTGYAVYRRVESLPPLASAVPDVSARSGPVSGPDAVALAGWDYLGTQPAAGDPEYSMVVPTLADANASSVYYTSYLVRALTPDPITHFDSFPAFGYSVDNLSPPAPTPFTAAYTASATFLHWGVSSAPDFATFRLYKSATADFTPDAGNRVASTTDTNLVDTGPAGSYYKLSAVDLNGNESAFASLGPQQTTSVGPPPALALTLDGVRPNPTAGRSLAVAFALPAASPAQLELLDLMGRLVTRREVGTLGAGRHVVDLAAGRKFAPGLYLVRLRQGGNSRVTQVVVIE